jgi:hypothetical protein
VWTDIGGGSHAAGAGWNDVRITVSGTTVNVYVNGSGSPLITATTSLATGNKVGMRSDAAFTRIKSIKAI